jgi:hypothetical protein
MLVRLQARERRRLSMGEKRIGRNRAQKRALEGISSKDLAGVNGGISKALHNLNEKSKHALKTFFTKTLPKGLEKIPGPIGGLVKGIDQLAHHQRPTGFIDAVGLVPGVSAGIAAATRAIATPLANGMRGGGAAKAIAINGAVEAASALPGPSKFAGTAAKIAVGTVKAANTVYQAVGNRRR